VGKEVFWRVVVVMMMMMGKAAGGTAQRHILQGDAVG